MSDRADSVKEERRAKNNEYKRQWRERNKDYLKEWSRKKYLANKEVFKERNKRWRLNNLERCAEIARVWREKNQEWRMFVRARERAKKDGSPFSIEVSDIVIPERCPISTCGVVLTIGGGSRHSSASLDKVIPALGYTPGNVAVICDSCNRKKQNSTAEELLAIAEYITRIREERGLC